MANLAVLFLAELEVELDLTRASLRPRRTRTEGEGLMHMIVVDGVAGFYEWK
jgi:hypothetical protein